MSELLLCDASIHGRRGQPGRPSAGLSASKRDMSPDTRPALLRSVPMSGPLRPIRLPARQSGRVLQRPPAGTIPDTPGSYQFKDRDGRVIYVGKAKSLRSRLSNYFQNPANLLPRTAQLVAAAETVEWIEVRNEVEALMLEYNLIQRHRPRFNVRLRDDKSYPYLAITMSDDWPRA